MSADDGDMLLTVFLKHDQTKTLAEINEHRERTGFNEKFPPEGIEVVSWYVMMGIGQVVTLKLPAHRLREVNLSVERTAWGAFSTEFYATYDLRPSWEEKRREMLAKRSPDGA
jgi:hypothetical protein